MSECPSLLDNQNEKQGVGAKPLRAPSFSNSSPGIEAEQIGQQSR
jgi:hypothetical protein